MAWERRARGGLYYTRSRRVNGRVVREYVGTGQVADLAARVDAEARARRTQAVATSAAERARLDALDEQVTTLSNASETLARSSLLVAGYYRHARGEWRRRRG